MAETRFLSRSGLVWRLISFGLLFALTVLGTAVLHDPWWPIGPQKQYATGANLNGMIRSAYAVATLDDGRQVRVPFGVNGIGIGRAEIEGQLQRFIDDPSLLQALAVAHARKMPDEPDYVQVTLMQKHTPLINGVEQAPQDVTLAEWTVIDPENLG
ncbi:hypothetical protein LWF01_08855 [Saxibacter everestensis]|uniref:Uncharacterized protein n=1 Tax=Saxibacter everestensis TaxID=2909229 RepID=A0ABY8R092_9MICO|nr:hypothetical protein LWF01_08855 [Brevibacteriaceae bacterium ZFBP1038]